MALKKAKARVKVKVFPVLTELEEEGLHHPPPTTLLPRMIYSQLIHMC